MPEEALAPDRQIVTCDDCGTPFPAVEDEGEIVLVGPDDGACPNCAGEAFSKLSL